MNPSRTSIPSWEATIPVSVTAEPSLGSEMNPWAWRSLKVSWTALASGGSRIPFGEKEDPREDRAVITIAPRPSATWGATGSCHSCLPSNSIGALIAHPVLLIHQTTGRPRLGSIRHSAASESHLQHGGNSPSPHRAHQLQRYPVQRRAYHLGDVVVCHELLAELPRVQLVHRTGPNTSSPEVIETKARIAHITTTTTTTESPRDYLRAKERTCLGKSSKFLRL